jgi:hypothetical protein
MRTSAAGPKFSLKGRSFDLDEVVPADRLVWQTGSLLDPDWAVGSCPKENFLGESSSDGELTDDFLIELRN